MRTLSVQQQFMPLPLGCLCSVPGNLAGTAFWSASLNLGAAVIRNLATFSIEGLKSMKLFEIKDL